MKKVLLLALFSYTLATVGNGQTGPSMFSQNLEHFSHDSIRVSILASYGGDTGVIFLNIYDHATGNLIADSVDVQVLGSSFGVFYFAKGGLPSYTLLEYEVCASNDFGSLCSYRDTVRTTYAPANPFVLYNLSQIDSTYTSVEVGARINAGGGTDYWVVWGYSSGSYPYQSVTKHVYGGMTDAIVDISNIIPSSTGTLVYWKMRAMNPQGFHEGPQGVAKTKRATGSVASATSVAEKIDSAVVCISNVLGATADMDAKGVLVRLDTVNAAVDSVTLFNLTSNGDSCIVFKGLVPNQAEYEFRLYVRDNALTYTFMEAVRFKTLQVPQPILTSTSQLVHAAETFTWQVAVNSVRMFDPQSRVSVFYEIFQGGSLLEISDTAHGLLGTNIPITITDSVPHQASITIVVHAFNTGGHTTLTSNFTSDALPRMLEFFADSPTSSRGKVGFNLHVDSDSLLCTVTGHAQEQGGTHTRDTTYFLNEVLDGVIYLEMDNLETGFTGTDYLITLHGWNHPRNPSEATIQIATQAGNPNGQKFYFKSLQDILAGRSSVLTFGMIPGGWFGDLTVTLTTASQGTLSLPSMPVGSTPEDKAVVLSDLNEGETVNVHAVYTTPEFGSVAWDTSYVFGGAPIGITVLPKESFAFANPVEGNAQVRLTAGTTGTVFLYDLMGMEVGMFYVQEGMNTLETGNLPSGCYLFRLATERGSLNGRMMKK